MAKSKTDQHTGPRGHHKARYVDGYVLAIPKSNIATYQRIALKASKIWREHGTLEVRECKGNRDLFS